MSQLTSEYDFENAPCGYLSFYTDGTITGINQTLAGWLHCTKAEVVGVKKLDSITAKGTGLYFQMFVYPLLKMQGYVNEISINVLSATNESISCLFNASAVRNEDDGIQQIHAILFRISDRKKYEEEVLKAKKTAEAVAERKEQILELQRRIVSILGHDTRAPLHSVNRIIKLAAEGKMAPDELFPYFELMANQLDATLILINDLLNWSNVLFNNKTEKPASFSLAGVTEEVFELLQGNAMAKGLYLKNDVDPALTLVVHRSIVTFILRNLVNNAIKFTQEGGVTVGATWVDNALQLTVSDTGVGMQPDQVEKFIMGNLGSTVGTQNEKGSGMGMVLINEFVLQLKGSLQAESVTGSGTAITLSLPITYKPTQTADFV